MVFLFFSGWDFAVFVFVGDGEDEGYTDDDNK